MKRLGLAVGGVWLLSLAAALFAQRSGTTALVVNIAPEAHLNPAQVALQFRISADGSSDIGSQSQEIAAWVRALPGRPIRLTASIAGFTGPSGTVPISALGWSGEPTRATAGGQAAACTSGSFGGGAPQDLVSGWTRSGTLACRVAFSLADPRSLTPGLYSGVVNLTLRAE